MDIRQIAAAFGIDISVASALMKNLAAQGRITSSPDTSVKNKRGKAKTLYHIPATTMDSLRNLFGTTGNLTTTAPTEKIIKPEKAPTFKIELGSDAYITADLYQYVLVSSGKKSYYSSLDWLLKGYMNEKTRTSDIATFNDVITRMQTLFDAAVEKFQHIDPVGFRTAKVVIEQDDDIEDDVIDAEVIEEQATGVMGMKRIKVPTTHGEEIV